MRAEPEEHLSSPLQNKALAGSARGVPNFTLSTPNFESAARQGQQPPDKRSEPSQASRRPVAQDQTRDSKDSARLRASHREHEAPGDQSDSVSRVTMEGTGNKKYLIDRALFEKFGKVETFERTGPNLEEINFDDLNSFQNPELEGSRRLGAEDAAQREKDAYVGFYEKSSESSEVSQPGEHEDYGRLQYDSKRDILNDLSEKSANSRINGQTPLKTQIKVLKNKNFAANEGSFEQSSYENIFSKDDGLASEQGSILSANR